MDTNSQTLFSVRQAEHHLRLRESQRLRDAELAAGIQPARLHVFSLRAWMSTTLVTAGDRIQEKLTLKPAQADPIR